MDMPMIKHGLIVTIESHFGLHIVCGQNYKADRGIAWVAIDVESGISRCFTKDEVEKIYKFVGAHHMDGDCVFNHWPGGESTTVKLSGDELKLQYKEVWARPRPKKMTHVEIAEALGHEFEYVEE